MRKGQSKWKAVAIVTLIMLIHFGLMVALVVSRLSCGMQPHCVSTASEIAGQVLSFPLGLVGLALDHMGVDVDEAIRRYLGGEFVVILLVNSLLMAIIIWFGMVKPIARRRSKSA